MNYEKLTIYTDGGARGNPGPAAIGAVIYDNEKNIIQEISEYIGETTNNQAEYRACLSAMEAALKLGAQELDFYLDSELVVKQLKREYKVKNKDLAPLFIKIYNLSQQFIKVKFTHINREENKLADSLVNKALDAGM